MRLSVYLTLILMSKTLVYSKIYRTKARKLEWCKNLTYLSPNIKQNVALVGFPSSGLNWLRYLLQQATGIYTGSVFIDDELEKLDMPGNITKGVLVVRQSDPLKEPTIYTKSIVLLRHPKDTLMSLYNFLYGGRKRHAPISSFEGQQWIDYVDDTLNDWASFYIDALAWTEGPIHVVIFEMVAEETRNTLEDVLTFIGYDYTQTDIDCALYFRRSPLYRKQREFDFDPYSPSQQYLLDHYARKVLEEVQKYQEAHAVPGWV